jgi:citrate lyase subunit beta/citryl-CoA lyase
MAMTTRLRRSILYMPGSNARALEKGRGLAADGLILDLEDAVAPDAKERARSQITDALNEGGYGHRELIVRVNAMDTPWGKEDIAAMATSGAHGILLTKVDSAAMVQEAEALMAASNAPDDMTIWTMMETPLGILHSEEIAFSSPRMGAFVHLWSFACWRRGPQVLPLLMASTLILLTMKVLSIHVVRGRRWVLMVKP